MQTNELIPTLTQYSDERVWLLDEVISLLQETKAKHGNIPVVGRGYEMGMDNLEPETVTLYHGYEGCCGAYSDSPHDEHQKGVLALTFGNAG